MSNRKRDTKKQQTPAKFSNDKLLNKYDPVTENHKEYVRSIIENPVTICCGMAGTGKTAIALSLACEHLTQGKIDKIIVTRPFVECSVKGLGFLKGSLEEKTEPYLMPFMDYFEHILGIPQFTSLLSDGRISIQPLEFMRGITINSAYLIVDEAQNCSIQQLTLALTRISEDSKIILNGDIKQSDLNGKYKSGLDIVADRLKDIKGCNVVYFDRCDVMRNGLIADIMEALEC